jgi:colicin import membrane protein
MTDTFSRSIWVSVMMHGCVLMVIFLRAVIIHDDPYLQTRNVIRVDVVGLPEKVRSLPDPTAEVSTKAEPPAPKAIEKPVAKPKAPPKEVAPQVNLNKKDASKAQKEALRKLEAMSALEKIKNQVAQEKASTAAKAKAVAGNQISKGNALEGLAQYDFDKYRESIKDKVYSNWNLPQWLSEVGYHAVINVQIDDHGVVVQKTMRKSSGNEIFDTKCMEAIDASSPFPEPPSELRGRLSTSGISFAFPQQ